MSTATAKITHPIQLSHNNHKMAFQFAFTAWTAFHLLGSVWMSTASIATSQFKYITSVETVHHGR